MDALNSDVGRALQEQVPNLGDTALAYYRDTTREDLHDRMPVDILGAVISQMELAQARRESEFPNQPKVRLSTPTHDRDGWTCEHTVVEIVANDEPFIVDSVTAALTQANRKIMLTVHPIIENDGHPESWMHVEIDRESDAETLSHLASTLESVLHDVSAAVADWQPMVAKAREIAAQLRTRPESLVAAGISEAECDQAAELMEWIADNNFTLLGYREYELLEDENGEAELVSIPTTGLGMLRGDDASKKSFTNLPQRVREKAREHKLLVLTKANRRSTVHRPAYLDYIGVKEFDDLGNVVGEHRFIGLLTAGTYANSATQIPVAREKIRQVIEQSGFEPGSHSARDLLHFCETYPRDELFQVTPEQLLSVARQVIAIGERRQTRVFVRDDDYGRFASVLVYLPRDRYTTDVRMAITGILADTYDSTKIDFVARVSESVLARLHFVVRFAPDQLAPDVDVDELNDRIKAVVSSWEDHFEASLGHVFGEEEATDLFHSFAFAFPDSYKADVSPRTAVSDVQRMLGVGEQGVTVKLHEELAHRPNEYRFTLYSVGEPVELAELLPVFRSLGADVLEERPYEIERLDAPKAWIYDVGIRLKTSADETDQADQANRFCAAFLAIWRGDAEADRLNTLVAVTQLDWRQVSWLRSWVHYGQQIASPYSASYVERVLLEHNEIASLLVAMFGVRFDPAVAELERERQYEKREQQCRHAIDGVASLDADRILRQLHGIVAAIVRTNVYQVDSDGNPRPAVAHKLEPRRIPDLPEPAPAFEIWVSSPRINGVHLRFGKIARGGLRWSDRPEDMRTEILGLVKAQMVKNAVIVPVGAKGGFFVKHPGDPLDRAQWMATGVECYREFITTLLQLTDNRVRGEVVKPARTVCLDGDDPYLVVAADKGTATFSDIANEIAVAHDFWLGDAFASGGSNGYDHKAMGITAKGAWESVRRHFLEMNIDVQSESVTVVGIGDMSGDVFGNGMLLSQEIKLTAAFDHRHIFLDPNPDPHSSFEERKRLAGLDRSSWDDYNKNLISEGGGVFPRSLKAVPISEEVRQRLGIAAGLTELSPPELIHAILLAPVDLLFNGGIGTYVKSVTEQNAEVGDKANDSIRVNGAALRVKVVGEGGNLGLTQRGRIEAARAGVRLNTDAIDNSAGVDCSDHEVNIKILLDHVVAEGDMTVKQRNELLTSMTSEVSSLVLAENYRQNVVLMYSRAKSDDLLPVHRRLIDDLELTGFVDRELEQLPQDGELAEMFDRGVGLTSPELCVMLSWVKIKLTEDLSTSSIATEAWFNRYIVDYFPPELGKHFRDAMDAHPLRAQIINTMVANDIVDCGGISFVHRAQEETGASPVEVVRAYCVATEVFGLREVWRAICDLDDIAPTKAQVALHLEARRLLDRATRWVLASRGGTVDVAGEIGQFADAVAELSGIIDRLLIGAQRERFLDRTAEFVELGAPPELSAQVAGMLERFCLLDIDDLANRYHEQPESVAEVYFAVSEHYGFDALLTQITRLPRSDRWDNLARAAMRSDLYSVLAGLTSKILRASDEDTPPESRIASWEQDNFEGQQRARATLSEIAKADTSDLATLSVALRTLRTLVAQGRSPQRDDG